MDNTESTTNLLLAAYLVTGGATVLSLEESGRYTRVHLDLSTLTRSSLAGHAEQLAMALRCSDCGMASLEELFEFSLLGRVDTEYQKLKRLISIKRSTRVTSN